MAKSPLSVNKFRYAFFVWWLVWGSLHAIVISNFGFPSNIAVLDSVVTNFQLMGACWLVNTILKYYLPQAERYWSILALSAGLSGLTLLNVNWILKLAWSDKPAYLDFISKSWSIRFGIAFLLVACMTMVCVLWYALEEKDEQQQRKRDAERLAREAELFNLRQQLQPHFLFNSLNSISALVGSQPEQARKMIQQLSDFLRSSIKKDEQQWILLSEELQNLQLYLDIEKVRFGHRLFTAIDAGEDSFAMKLPPMLLQPIVENAIKFGLYDTTGEVTISITTRALNNYLQVTVENPYDPATSHPKKGAGFGLNSVQRRLYLLFARNDLLEITAKDHLFTITVKIPQ